MSSSLPQWAYYQCKYRCPGGLSLTGHSRAMERTGFFIEELGVMLDAGVDMPTTDGCFLVAVLCTHTHIDHMNALPMLLRHGSKNPARPTIIFAPAAVTRRLRQFGILSFSVKCDEDEDLVMWYRSDVEDIARNPCAIVQGKVNTDERHSIIEYTKHDKAGEKEKARPKKGESGSGGAAAATTTATAPSSEGETVHQLPSGAAAVEVATETTEQEDAVSFPASFVDKDGWPLAIYDHGDCRLWQPVEPGMNFSLMKGGRHFNVRTVKLFHTVTTCGYVLSERRKKARADLTGATKAETAAMVKAALARGESVSMTYDDFLLAYLCDTTIKVLHEEPQTSNLILKCKTIMIECSFLEEDMREEGEKRGHAIWVDIAPFVLKSVQEKSRGDQENGKDGFPHPVWILFHFSLRYSDEQIREYFDKTGGGIGLKRQPPLANNNNNNNNNRSNATSPAATPRSTDSSSTNNNNSNNNNVNADGTPRKPSCLVLWLDTGLTEYYIDGEEEEKE